MRLKLLTVALALAAAPFASHAEDLLDAYRRARANDPVLSQADSTRLATGEGVTQARALLLPQVSAQLSLVQTDPNGPTTGAKIERSTDGGLSYQLLATRPAGTVTYTDADGAASMRSLIAEGYRPYAPTPATTLSGPGRLGRVGFVHWRKDLQV